MATDLAHAGSPWASGIRRSLPDGDVDHRGHLLGTALMFVVATLFYRLMWSPMPVDDAARYVAELRAGRDVWDMAHLWIEPIALRVYRAGGGTGDPAITLAWLNTVSVGVALAVFYRTVRSATRSTPLGVLATALAAVSFNLVSLGPTAHIKAMVMPFFALGLHFGWAWEQGLHAGLGRLRAGVQQRRLALAGALLGVGACFLVTTVPLAAFAWLAMLVHCRLRGASWWQALSATIAFPAAGALAGAAGLALAYWTAMSEGSASGSIVAFLMSGLGAKYDVNQFPSSLASRVARSAYSIVYNFVYVPDAGQYGRAYLDRLLPSLRPYAGAIVRDMALAAVVLGALAFAVGKAVHMGAARRRPTLVALGFVAGGLVYAFLLNLNDPEHWFQLTLPLVFCLAMSLSGTRHATAALALCVLVIGAPNMGLYVWPRVSYPMEQARAEFFSRLGPRGIHVNYAGYPGNMATSLFGGLPSERNVRPDTIFEEQGQDVARTLAAIDAALAPALQAGDPVLAFRIFDESDWRGPVASLAARGLSPDVLRRHLREKYRVTQAGKVAGFDAYAIEARAPGDRGN